MRLPEVYGVDLSILSLLRNGKGYVWSDKRFVVNGMSCCLLSNGLDSLWFDSSRGFLAAREVISRSGNLVFRSSLEEYKDFGGGFYFPRRIRFVQFDAGCSNPAFAKRIVSDAVFEIETATREDISIDRFTFVPEGGMVKRSPTGNSTFHGTRGEGMAHLNRIANWLIRYGFAAGKTGGKGRFTSNSWAAFIAGVCLSALIWCWSRRFSQG